jgi:D-inositol-3-phosphate glycosyltransferase
MDKKKVLFWGDNPHGITGFGKVIKNIIRQIYNEDLYSIDVLGISYFGDPYKPDVYKGKPLLYDVYPPFEVGKQYDPYGTAKLMRFISTGKVDILFILQDTFVIRNSMQKIIELRDKLKKKFKIIYYFPIDSNPNSDWVNRAVSLADFPVCYTNWGKTLCVKHDPKLKMMEVIYHGTDKNVFKPLGQARLGLRESFWGKEVSDKFIIINVNRNQPRKDLNRTFSAFSILKKTKPDSYLFMLSNPNDIGGNLLDIASQYGLEYGIDWSCPDPTRYDPLVGIPEDQVSIIYATADVCISTTLGEGWGLSLTEAMACGCPVVFPDNTSITEIIGRDSNRNGIRGELAISGDSGNTICLGPTDMMMIRPLTNVMDLVIKIAKVIDYKNSLKQERALEWVPDWDSEEIGGKWRKIFKEASE